MHLLQSVVTVHDVGKKFLINVSVTLGNHYKQVKMSLFEECDAYDSINQDVTQKTIF